MRVASTAEIFYVTANEVPSRSELDSHANMPVVGKHATILADTEKIAEVNAFSPENEALQVPIVDAAIQEDCPYTGMSAILVLRGSLHMPSMNLNLVPPFMLRETELIVKDVPKI